MREPVGRTESRLKGRVIFNVGARRSGTYWLQRIVTAHPLVGEVPSETHLLSHGIAPLLERFQDEDPGSQEVGRTFLERGAQLDWARDLCDRVFSRYAVEGGMVAERTPLHVFHLPLISEIYPDARFVHIIRDGRDSARSIAAQNWGPETVADAAREWRDAVRAGISADIDGDRYLEVRYEALLADREPQIRRLYEWLALPASPVELEHGVSASYEEANVDRFGVGGVATQKWRSAFSAKDLAAFEAVAGDLLEELGYERAGVLSRGGAGSGVRSFANRIRRG